MSNLRKNSDLASRPEEVVGNGIEDLHGRGAEGGFEGADGFVGCRLDVLRDMVGPDRRDMVMPRMELGAMLRGEDGVDLRKEEEEEKKRGLVSELNAG